MKNGIIKGILALTALLAVGLLCVCVGSVNIPIADVIGVVTGQTGGASRSILLNVRLPRVLCSALSGAGLAVCGCAMQGLLRNPLAEGSTLGVSSGAALGAVLALFVGMQAQTAALLAMAFAFVSFLVILGLAFSLDRSISTNTIILVGVIFSMLCSSVLSLIITFAGEKLKTITFWTMGSLAGSTYRDAAMLLAAVIVCGGVLCLNATELDAFAMGEENARHIGVNIRRTRLTVMAAVSVLIGVCVSVGGTIGFVGLIIPHMVRMCTSPKHKSLLPLSMLCGALFLMLTDLLSRTLLSPRELPIGVITSLIGAVTFFLIFFRSRRSGAK